MVVKCKGGKKPKFRFRTVVMGKAKQRLAFCGDKLVEITFFANGKKVGTRKFK